MSKLKSDNTAGQLGFVYQNLYGLHLLLKTEEECTIVIEKIDDIAIIYGDGRIHCYQTKLKSSGNITKGSDDFWTTIESWSESIKNGGQIRINKENCFFLVTTEEKAKTETDTTNKIINKSIEDRDDDFLKEIQKEILFTAQKKETDQLKKDNENNKKWNITNSAKPSKKQEPAKSETLTKPESAFKGKKFIDLNDDQQLHLIKQMIIKPEQENYTDLIKKIRHELRKHHSHRFEEFYTDVRDKWNGICIDILDGTRENIGDYEFTDMLEPIKKRYDINVLDYSELKKYNGITDDAIKELLQLHPIFKKQTELVNFDEDQLRDSILYLAKAFHQRTVWETEHTKGNNCWNLDLDTDFEERLISYFKRLLPKLRRDSNNKPNHEKAIIGNNFYANFIEREFNIPYKTGDNSYIDLILGSFHLLSNQVKIGWHSDYENLKNT